MNRIQLMLAAIIVAAPTALAQPARGPNGGVVAMADRHPVEFVANGTEITFYLGGEDGRPLSSAGASGRVSFQQGGRTVTITLAAAPPNKLVGTLAAPLAPGTKLVVSTKIHGHAIQLRFET